MRKLIYFGAPWCHPCKAVSRIVDSMSDTFDVRKKDVTTDAALALVHNVKSTPTIVILDEKEHEVMRFTSKITRERLLEYA